MQKPTHFAPSQAYLAGVSSGHRGEWPDAGWVPYPSGPLTVPVGPRPKFAAGSQSVIDTLWAGRPDDAAELQVYSGSPPPPKKDYSGDVLYFGKTDDPTYTITCSEYGGTCSAAGIAVHIPKGAYPAGGTDRHIVIRDTVTGKDVLLWQAPIPDGERRGVSGSLRAAIDSNRDGLNAIAPPPRGFPQSGAFAQLTVHITRSIMRCWSRSTVNSGLGTSTVLLFL